MRPCHRWWLLPPPGNGIALCLLRKGHGGTRCIDTYRNISHPTADTQPSKWDEAQARRAT